MNIQKYTAQIYLNTQIEAEGCFDVSFPVGDVAGDPGACTADHVEFDGDIDIE